MSKALMDGLQQVAGHLGRQVVENMYRSAMDKAPGGSKEVDQAVEKTQGRTPYRAKEYIAETAEQEQKLYDRDKGAATDSFYRTEQANQRRKKADFMYDTAGADQQNRANAATAILQGYNQARAANQDFLANINRNSMSA